MTTLRHRLDRLESHYPPAPPIGATHTAAERVEMILNVIERVGARTPGIDHALLKTATAKLRSAPPEDALLFLGRILQPYLDRGAPV